MIGRITEAAKAAYFTLTEGFYYGLVAKDTVGASADRLFRSLRGSQVDRDLPPYLFERILKQAWWSYVRNPVAKRGLETARDFLLGEGLRLKSSDELVQRELERHWNHPRNSWERTLPQRVLELGMYGEWCSVACVNATNGETTWVYVDPLMIDRVIPDERNPALAKWVVLKGGLPTEHLGSACTRGVVVGKDGKPIIRKMLRVIYRDEVSNSPTFGKLIGDCVYARINTTTYATRGHSDLTTVLDWLDHHEEFMVTVAEAAQAKIAHVWDVSVRGATTKMLQAIYERFSGPITPGTLRCHSDRVTIQNISAQLNTSDLAEHGRLLKRHIAVGMGVPEHWLGEGAEGSGEGVLDTSTPATKNLRARSRFVREVLRAHLDFALDQRKIARQIPATTQIDYKIIAPPLWPIDVQRISAAILTTVQGMQAAVDMGAVTPEEARQVILLPVSMLGVDAESFDRSTESPPKVDALPVIDPRANGNGNGVQPSQMAQRHVSKGGALSLPAMPGGQLGTLQGMS